MVNLVISQFKDTIKHFYKSAQAIRQEQEFNKGRYSSDVARELNNELISKLQAKGVQFGGHVNAWTSFDETVYYVNMPNDDEMLEMAKGPYLSSVCLPTGSLVELCDFLQLPIL